MGVFCVYSGCVCVCVCGSWCWYGPAGTRSYAHGSDQRPGGWRAGAHATGGGCRPMCEEGSREEGRTVYILDICSFRSPSRHLLPFVACRDVRSARTLHGTMLSRLAPRRRALSSATRALRPLRVGGVPEHFNTPWHTAHAAGRFDELGLQVDS